jgi:hypothetical protein
MAENEILDLSSRRWQNTRAALAKPDLSFAAMAECVADNLQSVLHLQLANAFRKGQTLLAVFEAVDQHPAAMRAAVNVFQDQQLVRIARDATLAAKSKDVASIALCAADMLVDGLIKKTLMFANQNGCFEDRDRLASLRGALEHEFSGRRSLLAGVIQASLHGQSVRRYKTVRQERTSMTAASLARSPLTILNKGGGNHVPLSF